MKFGDLLQEKLGKHDPGEIEELVLDGIFQIKDSLDTNHKQDLEKYSSLIRLCMNKIGVKSLQNFPKLPALQILELSDNNLDGKDLADLASLYPKLYKLKIGNNNIESVENLKGLSSLNLEKLQVGGNPFSEAKENYREDIFKMFPNLKVIDNVDKEGEEVESTLYGEDEEGEDLEEGEEFEDQEEEPYEDLEEIDEDEEDEDDEEEEEEKLTKRVKKH